MRIGAAAGAVLLAAAACGSASAEPAACRGAERPREMAELIFGRRIGKDGIVAEAAWQRFVAREIIPRFADGLTIIAANGQWRDPATRRISREPATLVIIAMPGGGDDHERLVAISEAYKKLFRQRSVGIIVHAACVSF
jgi:Protein of unknown function (DUF3574)